MRMAEGELLLGVGRSSQDHEVTLKLHGWLFCAVFKVTRWHDCHCHPQRCSGCYKSLVGILLSEGGMMQHWEY